MKKVLVKFSVMSVAMLLLYGCATRGPVETEALSPLAKDLAAWQWNGRMVLHHHSKSWRVGVFWQQDQEEYTISLQAWLGQQLARLQTERDSVVLSRPRQPPVQAASATALLAEVFGWRLPVEGLRHWIVGQAAPLPVSGSRYDRLGRLQWLEQQGWHVDYDEYQHVTGRWLPTRLRLERPDLSVRIVVDHWMIVRES